MGAGGSNRGGGLAHACRVASMRWWRPCRIAAHPHGCVPQSSLSSDHRVQSGECFSHRYVFALPSRPVLAGLSDPSCAARWSRSEWRHIIGKKAAAFEKTGSRRSAGVRWVHVFSARMERSEPEATEPQAALERECGPQRPYAISALKGPFRTCRHMNRNLLVAFMIYHDPPPCASTCTM